MALGKRKYRFWLWGISLIGLAIIVMGLASPFSRNDLYGYKAVVASAIINAPADSVYRYLGNSAHARDWSVFVHHISPLNTDSFPDGAPGSRRRCFCQADEEGMQWDELITVNEPNRRRQLTIYHLVEFPVKSDNLVTEQIYTVLNANRCRLSFTVFFKNGESGIWDGIKMRYGAWYMKSVLDRNLDRIKRINEGEKVARQFSDS